jgi:hypothetical protein
LAAGTSVTSALAAEPSSQHILGEGTADMDLLEPVVIRCPYCGAENEMLVDCLPDRQDYVEDCQVCCKPIQLSIAPWEDDAQQVDVRAEDE